MVPDSPGASLLVVAGGAELDGINVAGTGYVLCREDGMVDLVWLVVAVVVVVAVAVSSDLTNVANDWESKADPFWNMFWDCKCRLSSTAEEEIVGASSLRMPIPNSPPPMSQRL